TVPKPLIKRKALVPATAVRRPDGVGNRRPTWIGTGGRHQSECPADIVGLRMKSIVSIQPATNARTVLGSVSIRRFDDEGTNARYRPDVRHAARDALLPARR